jgi:ribosome-associated heat shock protein Hsp15
LKVRAPKGSDAQRIDKWLWCARIVKTRALAQKLAEKGAIRLTRAGAVMRIEKAHFEVRSGDRLAFMIGGRMRLLDVLQYGVRRGPASEARLLYAEAGADETRRECG